jgi:hypothetical protein
MMTLTCKQVQQFKIHYDDITYDKYIIDRFMLCGIIISYRETLSVMKKLIRVLKLKDSTGICSLQVFHEYQSR